MTINAASIARLQLLRPQRGDLIVITVDKTMSRLEARLLKEIVEKELKETGILGDVVVLICEPSASVSLTSHGPVPPSNIRIRSGTAPPKPISASLATIAAAEALTGQADLIASWKRMSRTLGGGPASYTYAHGVRSASAALAGRLSSLPRWRRRLALWALGGGS